jgi:hypothetical protein
MIDVISFILMKIIDPSKKDKESPANQAEKQAELQSL